MHSDQVRDQGPEPKKHHERGARGFDGIEMLESHRKLRLLANRDSFLEIGVRGCRDVGIGMDDESENRHRTIPHTGHSSELPRYNGQLLHTM